MSSSDDPFGDNNFDDIDFDALERSALSESAKRESQGGYEPPNSSPPSRFDIEMPGSSRTMNPDEKFPPTPPHKMPEVTPLVDSVALNATLSKYFGFSKFLPNQQVSIQHILASNSVSNDLCAYLPTGSGKSLIYTIPPLHTGRPAVVVSPLISLMEDQVYKLNVVAGRKIAGFLSTSTSREENDACARGDRLLVYLTPEKLPYWLDNVVRLHQQTKGGLSLIAIDEAHCVSEWGHDFRSDYRKLDVIRSTPELKDVPIIALTATSTSQVRTDVVKSLMLKNPKIVTASVDRPNLVLQVERKSPGGYALDLKWLVDKVKGNPTNEATIIYCYSKRLVDEVCAWLQGAARDKKIATKYHAGLGDEERREAHINFLTSSIPIIVATTAFGMGIDKPDTRRVINYTPPKTMEEYYQQVGRAGRDNLPATCIMYCNQADFDRYGGDFYTGGFSNESAKKAVVSSTHELNRYSFEGTECRRAMVMKYFGEQNNFPNGCCGTCDNCQRKAQGGVRTVDMKLAAAVVFKAVSNLKEPSTSVIEKVVGEKVVEDYRYNYGVDKMVLKEEIKALRTAVPREYNSVKFFKELVPELENSGYLFRAQKKANVGGGRQNNYSVYSVNKARASGPVVLPTWKAIERLFEEKEKKKQQLKQELKSLGMTDAMLTKEYEQEVEMEGGPNINAFRRWRRKIQSCQDESPLKKRLLEFEDLLKEWRLEASANNRVAPVNVCTDAVIWELAYAVAKETSVENINETYVKNMGVRVAIPELVKYLQEWALAKESERLKGDFQRNVEKYPEGSPQRKCLLDLADALKAWRSEQASLNNVPPSGVIQEALLWKMSYVVRTLSSDEIEPFILRSGASVGAIELIETLLKWRKAYPERERQAATGRVMIPKEGFCPARWDLAKPGKFVAPRLALWQSGQDFATIAMNNQPKPIQANTVRQNIFDAFEAGMDVDLVRLLRESGRGGPPNEEEWDIIEGAAAAGSLDVVGEVVKVTQVVANIEGMAFVDFSNEAAFVAFNDRNDEQREKSAKWSGKVSWWLLFKRTGMLPGVGFDWAESGGGGVGGEGAGPKRKREE